jgi:hypothetical protein
MMRGADSQFTDTSQCTLAAGTPTRELHKTSMRVDTSALQPILHGYGCAAQLLQSWYISMHASSLNTVASIHFGAASNVPLRQLRGPKWHTNITTQHCKYLSSGSGWLAGWSTIILASYPVRQ